MLVSGSRYLCGNSHYILENFWSTQPTKERWLEMTSEWNGTWTTLGIFLYSDKCHFCGRKGITKWVMILNIQIHSPVVSQSFHFVDQHNVKKILSGYCGSKYCFTVPFSFSPKSFSFFSLQRLRDSGGWLVQKCRHTFLDLSGWPWKSSWWRWTSTHKLFLLLFPLTLLLWPLITLDMTVISWLYSQSRDISATFGSPLFLF